MSNQLIIHANHFVASLSCILTNRTKFTYLNQTMYQLVCILFIFSFSCLQTIYLGFFWFCKQFFFRIFHPPLQKNNGPSLSYGLRPRLWLLLKIELDSTFHCMLHLAVFWCNLCHTEFRWDKIFTKPCLSYHRLYGCLLFCYRWQWGKNAYRPVTRILCGRVLTRPKWTKLPKCIFYCLIRLFRKVAIHEKLQRREKCLIKECNPLES